MRKVFSVILSVIFGLCLLATLLLGVVRFNFSYSVITKIASEVMRPVSMNEKVHFNDGVFYPEQKVLGLAQYEDFGYEFDPSALEDIDLSQLDLGSMDVNTIVQSYLEKAGVDVEPEFIADVLASPEVSDFVDKYVGEVVNYMTGASTELNIDTKDIKKVVNKSLDMFEEHTGEKVDRTGLDEVMETTVEAMVPELTATLDAAKEENADVIAALKDVEFFLSMKFFLICVGVCVLLALIIFVINLNVFAWFKYIGMPGFVDGVLLFICACVAKGVLPGVLTAALKEAGMPGGVFEGIWSYVLVILAQMKVYGIVAAVLGCVFWTLGFSLSKKKVFAE